MKSLQETFTEFREKRNEQWDILNKSLANPKHNQEFNMQKYFHFRDLFDTVEDSFDKPLKKHTRDATARTGINYTKTYASSLSTKRNLNSILLNTKKTQFIKQINSDIKPDKKTKEFLETKINELNGRLMLKASELTSQNTKKSWKEYNLRIKPDYSLLKHGVKVYNIKSEKESKVLRKVINEATQRKHNYKRVVEYNFYKQSLN